LTFSLFVMRMFASVVKLQVDIIFTCTYLLYSNSIAPNHRLVLFLFIACYVVIVVDSVDENLKTAIVTAVATANQSVTLPTQLSEIVRFWRRIG